MALVGNCLPTVVGTHKVTGRAKNGYEKPGYEGDICPETITMTASCGDGIVQKTVGEFCDDGAGSDCVKNGCKLASCGNGGMDAGEFCDGDKDEKGYACNGTCTAYGKCGDGMIQKDLEACDDGNHDSEDLCSKECQKEFCGDGTLQKGLGEECEDGATKNGDGCDSTCMKEPVCTQAGVFETATKGVFQVDIAGTSATHGCVATNNPAEPFICHPLVEGKTTFNVNCEAPGGTLQAYVASIPIQNPLMEGEFKKAECPNTLTIACEKPAEPDLPNEDKCKDKDCSDDDECTTDSCNAGECGHVNIPDCKKLDPGKQPDSVKETLVEEALVGQPKPIDPVGTCASLDINCFSCIDAANQVRDLKANINQTTFKEFLELNNKSVTIMPKPDPGNADKSVTEILIDTATEGNLPEGNLPETKKNAMPACACPAPRATSLNNTKTTNNNPLVLNNLSCITAEQVKELETNPDKFMLDGVQTKIKLAGTGLYKLTTVKGEEITLPLCPCNPDDPKPPKAPPPELINQSPGGSVGTSLNIACFEDNPNEGVVMNDPGNNIKKGDRIQLIGTCPTENVWKIIETRGYNALDQVYRNYSKLAIGKKDNLDTPALTELNKKFIPVVEKVLQEVRNENKIPDTIPVVAAMIQPSGNAAEIKPDDFMAKNMDLMQQVAKKWLNPVDNKINVNAEGNAVPAKPESGKPGSGNAVPVTPVTEIKPESGKPESGLPGEQKPTTEAGTATTTEKGNHDNGVVDGDEECDFTSPGSGSTGTAVFGKIKTCSDWQAGFTGTVSCTPNYKVDTFSNCATACPEGSPGSGSTSTNCFTVGTKPESGKPDSGKPKKETGSDSSESDKAEQAKKGGKGGGLQALALSVNAAQQGPATRGLATQGLATGATLSATLDPISDQAAMVDNVTSVAPVVDLNTEGGGCSLIPDQATPPSTGFWMDVWSMIKVWVVSPLVRGTAGGRL